MVVPVALRCVLPDSAQLRAFFSYQQEQDNDDDIVDTLGDFGEAVKAGKLYKLTDGFHPDTPAFIWSCYYLCEDDRVTADFVRMVHRYDHEGG